MHANVNQITEGKVLDEQVRTRIFEAFRQSCFFHYEKNKLQERFSELERHNGSKTALLQHNCRTF